MPFHQAEYVAQRMLKGGLPDFFEIRLQNDFRKDFPVDTPDPAP